MMNKLTLFLTVFTLFAITLRAEPLSDLDLSAFQKDEKNQVSIPKNPFSQGLQSLNNYSKEDLRLNGIIRNDEKQWALVNGQIIKVGDQLAGYEVGEIKENSIILKQGNLSYELKPSGI